VPARCLRLHSREIVGVGALAACIVLATRLAAPQDQDFTNVEMKVTKVSGNVYMLEGAGGNIGVSVGEDGIVIVDDQFAPLADKIKAALTGIADKPLRFVINTHYHFDHVGSNAILQRDAPVIAHENVRKRLASGGRAGNFGSLGFALRAEPKEALPIITFDHQATVHLNGEDIRALHFPGGHTDGDSIIFFTKSNVVHMGDDFVTAFPAIDLEAGGSVQGMLAATEQVIASLPADVKVIPGHGPISTLDDLRKFATMLRDTRAVVDEGIRQGATLQQLQQRKVVERWEALGKGFISTDVYIETLYNDLTGRKSGKVSRHN